MVVGQSFETSRQHTLCDFGRSFDAVCTVHQDFWFDNGYQSVLLADGRVASQGVGIGVHGQLCGCTTVFDVKDGSPFGEPSTGSVVFGTTFTQIVHTLRHGFSVGVGQNTDTFVYFDASDDAVVG